MTVTLPPGLGHHVLQHQLALGHALVDALAGGAAHIQALHALADQVAGERPHPVGADGALIVIAGVECRDDALIFAEIAQFIDHSNIFAIILWSLVNP